MKSATYRTALIVLLAAAHPGIWAQSSPSSAPAAAAASVLTEAEVRRIDAANNRITLRHGPIPNLEMPPMTMQFQVRDAVLLQGLQEGSRIRFAAERINGQYTVTVVQPAP